ncbi:flagellar motor switch protein FliG [bacterium]|nr:flagellar motor switch protein FliG [bacterium]
MVEEEKLGVEKAAILLISLGPEVASKIYKKLSDNEIEALSTKISKIGTVKADRKGEILKEFYEMMQAQGYISQGGLEFAEEVLRKSVGDTKANRLLTRLQGFGEGTSFEMLKKVEPNTIANFLRNEHIQTIALVLANLDPAISGPVLAKLPTEIQGDVVYRIATMQRPNPEMLKSIEKVLEKHISSDFDQVTVTVGGTKSVADALNEMDLEMWQEILEDVEDINADIAQEIKQKMFVFKDLELLDNRSIQELLKDVETSELAISLKIASESIREKIFKNMSKRAALGLKEEIEYLGPMRLVEVEAMQQRIADNVRKLEGEGRIVISGRGGATSVMVD